MNMKNDSTHGEKQGYQLSGKPGLGWTILPLAGLVCGAAVGLFYGIINVWNPLIYFQIVGTVLGAGLVGFILNQLAGAAKCRSTLCVAISGLLGGIVLLYFSWVGFQWMCLQRLVDQPVDIRISDIALSPAGMWSMATAMATDGWFSLFGMDGTIKGPLLWCIWVIEAAILLFGPMAIGAAIFSDRIFCEDCKVWVRSKKGAQRIAVTRTTEVMAQNCDLEALAEAPIDMSVTSVGSYFRVDHALCEKCQNTGTCSVVKVEVTRDNDDKEQVSEDNVSGLIVLTPEKAQQLGHMVARIRQRSKEIREKRKAEAREGLKAKRARDAARKARKK